jgi:RNA polymerase sigma-70 factor (ECF subfamily)
LAQQSKETENQFLGKIQKHQGIIQKISLIFSNGREDKEDLSQEIVLQLWKSYPSFNHESSFSTWMYRVALNTAIGLTKNRKQFVEIEKHPIVVNETEHNLFLSEEVKILYKAISQLNKVEKAIVLLWLEEASYQEIADITGISVKNVSVKLVRIKARLAAIIKKLQ